MGIVDRFGRYGPNANAYDWLKCLAVITMTFDHFGMYWYQDELWLRVIGRVTFPIFFFLVGYSLRYRLKPDLLLGALIYAALNPLTFQPFFALNALVAVVMSRLAMPFIIRHQLIEKQPILVLIACLIFLLPLLLLVEYGSLAILFACLGYAHRQKLRSGKMVAFWLITLGAYFFVQHMWFAFSPEQSATLLLLLAAMTWILTRFDHEHAMPDLPAPANSFVKLTSRYSLHYYVVHKIIIQTLAVWLFMDAGERVFQWIQW